MRKLPPALIAILFPDGADGAASIAGTVAAAVTSCTKAVENGVVAVADGVASATIS